MNLLRLKYLPYVPNNYHIEKNWNFRNHGVVSLVLRRRWLGVLSNTDSPALGQVRAEAVPSINTSVVKAGVMT